MRSTAAVYTGTTVRTTIGARFEPSDPSSPKTVRTKGWYQVYIIHSRRKSIERAPHAPHCTDCTQTSTTMTGRPSPVDPLSLCAKRYERNQTKKSQTYIHIIYITETKKDVHTKRTSCTLLHHTGFCCCSYLCVME